MTPIEWLLSGDTGVSSKTICAVMTGSKMTNCFGPDVPYDSSDFGRCYRLLQHFPEWRARMPEVATAYPMWGPMVEAWDEMTALYERRMEPKLCERMRKLVDDGRRAAGWQETRPGCWSGPENDVLSAGGGGASFSFTA